MIVYFTFGQQCFDLHSKAVYSIGVKKIVFSKVNISILSTTLSFWLKGRVYNIIKNKTSLDTNHQNGTSEAILRNSLGAYVKKEKVPWDFCEKSKPPI